MPLPPTSWTSTGTTRNASPPPSRPSCWPSPRSWAACSALGPLFLLGGLLAAASLAHKGPGGFARGRLVRLGLPLLAFFGLLDQLTDYLGALAEGEHPGSGPTWPTKPGLETPGRYGS